MKLILPCGLIFQMPVAVSLLARVGITSAKALRSYRRYAILGMFVIAAIVAPPDPLSMVMFAMPLLALYEISIISASIVEPKPPPED
jgi:sec-independent protein translocase protein TatC